MTASIATRSTSFDAKQHESKPPSRFRSDIQGLRAVAVLLVALNHAGVGWLGGGYVGVDVFFVISGYVITGSLLGHEHRNGVSLVTFYAARARRILPMASVVLVATVIAAWQLLNIVRAREVITDAAWAGFFGANVHFWAQGTDYFSADLPPSPLQHYWSLAVEEQFYLVWPLLFGLLAFGLRGWRRESTAPTSFPTRRIAMALGIIIAASLLLSILQTRDDPTAAYFSPFSRTWELAVGGLLAIGAATIARVPGGARATLTWVGLAGIGISAVVLTAETPFPGSAALLPIASTAAIIAGGTGTPRGGAGGLLSLRPLRTIGDWSYSLYLWHWPLLIIAAGYAGQELPLWAGLCLVAIAVVLSGITYHLVEEPFRRGRWLQATRTRSFLVWPAALGTLALVSSVATSSLHWQAPATAPGLPPDARSVPGALPSDPAERVQLAVAAARAGQPIPADLAPPVDKIAEDWSGVIAADCATGSTSPVNPRICTYGDVSAKRSVVIIGDSHASMWMPALDAIGKRYGWAIKPLVKYSCTLSNKVFYVPRKGANEQCLDWGQWALQKVRELRPDRVIVASYAHYAFADEHGDLIPDAVRMNGLWRDSTRWAALQIKATDRSVAFLKDVPALGENPTDCLLRRDATLATCTFTPNEAQILRNQATQEGAAAAGVTFVDVDSWFCADGRCPTVVGSTVTHWDNNHVTRTYVLQLTDALAAKLDLAR